MSSAWGFSSTTWDFLINSIGLGGILCLAVPAWHANKYGRLVAQLARSRTNFTSPAVREARKRNHAALKNLQDEWTWWKSSLLIVGTALAGISYFLGMLKAVLV
jgi:hypothetical protein